MTNKYTQDDINNLFKKGNPSVVQRTKVKVISEDWGDDNYPDNTLGHLPDEEVTSENNTVEGLKASLMEPCKMIAEILASASPEIIDELNLSLDDALGEAGEDFFEQDGEKAVEVMKAVLFKFA